MKSGRFADNPAREIARFPEHVRTRRLSTDELSRVWKAVEEEREWADFFHLLILTGARRSAFCAMRWRDIDLDVGQWMVPVEWAKSKQEMAIPLTDEAVRILRARRDKGQQLEPEKEWVFPSTESKTGHIMYPEGPWKRILKAAGVTHATLHDLRRTMGSRLAMNRNPGATISQVLGHCSQQSLRPYVHLDVSAGRDAIEQAFAGVIDKKETFVPGN
jgi:integrase